MTDQPGEMRSDQRFFVEAEHRQGHVIHRIVRGGETHLKSLVCAELTEVLKSDADSGGYRERHILDRFPVSGHLSIRVAEEETHPTTVVEFPSQSLDERRLVKP